MTKEEKHEKKVNCNEVLTLIISLAAIIVSIIAFCDTSKFNKRTLEPYFSIEFKLFNESEINPVAGLVIVNHGGGHAILKNISVDLKNDTVNFIKIMDCTSWEKILNEVEIITQDETFEKCIECPFKSSLYRVIPAGDYFPLFTTYNKECHPNSINTNLRKSWKSIFSSVQITYENIYDRKPKIKTILIN